MILTITPNPTIDKVYFVDEFNMGEVHRPLRISKSAGGKGINVARVSHFLGEEALAMGFMGGASGDFAKKQLEELGIETSFTITAGETRTNVNISDKNGISGEILEEGPEVSAKEEKQFFTDFKEALPKADIICASGSLPRGIDNSFYCRLIRMAKGEEKKIIVDTSGKILEEVINEKPYMIKPNEYELSALFGKEIKSTEDIKNALLFIYEKGIEIPLITLGEKGAMAYIEGKFYKFTSPGVNVKNAVGSGDSTVGGIATGLSRGMSIIDSVKLGMAAGVANTQFEATGFVSKELVEKYYKEIYVEEA